MSKIFCNMGGMNYLVGHDDLVGWGDLFIDLIQLVNFGFMTYIYRQKV